MEDLTKYSTDELWRKRKALFVKRTALDTPINEWNELTKLSNAIAAELDRRKGGGSNEEIQSIC